MIKQDQNHQPAGRRRSWLARLICWGSEDELSSSTKLTRAQSNAKEEENGTPDSGADISSQFDVNEDLNIELLAGGQAANEIQGPKKQQQILGDSMQILLSEDTHIHLKPHVHTLLCDRRERICTAIGKLRELETLQVHPTTLSIGYPLMLTTWQIVGNTQNILQCHWVRGSSPSIDDSFVEIEGSAGLAEYTLAGGDVDQYIGFAFTRLENKVPVNCNTKDMRSIIYTSVGSVLRS